MSKTYSCAGVTLDYKSGKYIVSTIYKDGKQECKEFKNPLRANGYFNNQLFLSMSQSIRDYLRNQGKNQWTGCNETKMSCHDCKLTGNYKTKNCQLEEGGCSDEQAMQELHCCIQMQKL